MITKTKLSKEQVLIACRDWINDSIGDNSIWGDSFYAIETTDCMFNVYNGYTVFAEVELDVSGSSNIVEDASLHVTLKPKQIRCAVSEYIRTKFKAQMSTDSDTVTLKKNGTAVMTWSVPPED